MELSFSNSCLNSSLLSAPVPVLYAAAIARAGANVFRHEMGRGARGNLAAAANRGIRRSGRTIAPRPAWLYKEEGESKRQGPARGS